MSDYIELVPLAENPLGASRRRTGIASSNFIAGEQAAFIKLKHETGSELAGYQLARSIGVTAQRFTGLWCAVAMEIARQPVPIGRVGIAIELLNEPRPITREEAADRDPTATAKFLCLCMFNRHEWGEAVVEGETVKFIDFEYTLPAITPELIGADDVDPDYLESCSAIFRSCGVSIVEEVLEEAAYLRILPDLLAVVEGLNDAVRLTFGGHPHSQIIESHLTQGLRHRMALIRTLAAAA